VISPSQTSFPANLSIRAFDPLAGDEWDAMVASHPACSVFHGAGWARVLSQSYGHTPVYLSEMDGRVARSLLPVMEVNSQFTGRRGVALPFSDECGVLTNAQADASHLFDHAVELGRERRWKHLEVRGEIPGLAPGIAWATYVGHTLDVSRGAETLTAGLEASVRRAIRKAEKSGVRTRLTTSLEAMRGYYALHCLTRSKHGVPPQPFSFFRNIVEHLFQTGHGFIMEARHEDKLIAAGIFLHHERTAIYKFGASDLAQLNLRGNDLVMWEAILWFAAHGFTGFSMGRSAAANEGLRRFKRGFGTREQAIRYYRYDLRQSKFLAGREEKETWANRMLQLTPLPLFKMMGQTLYPHLD
jgi:CelD/BcsL family acetyltransferase involved in cellulose biosynthesis